jgi:hypothetical protein
MLYKYNIEILEYIFAFHNYNSITAKIYIYSKLNECQESRLLYYPLSIKNSNSVINKKGI